MGRDAVLDKLVDATNAHDVEAVTACFAAAYANETPVHPSRSFRGNAQVRRNWAQIFAAVPDLRAAVLRRAVSDGRDGTEVWSEWEMQGTRRDGSPHVMRGVIVFGVAGGLIDWARFYLEPLDASAGGVDTAVREQVVRGPR
jgi:ketosteroid isomerase-like protein